MCETRNDNALIRLNAIPTAERELLHACASRFARAGYDLILEWVDGDAVQRGADLKNESVAETLLARLVVVLRALDIRFRERRDANRAAQ
jgi:hypothetical protein